MFIIKVLFAFLLVLFFYCSNAQSTFTIIYPHSTDSLENNFHFILYHPLNLNSFEKSAEYKVEKTTSRKVNFTFYVNCNYKITDTSISIIGDGFGRESFAIPNDTVEISFHKIPKKDGLPMLNETHISTFFNQFSYIGKNKFIYYLFDSLAYRTNLTTIGNTITLKLCNYNLKSFFDTVTKTYKDRVAYLNYYSSKYNIPENIKGIVLSEIRCAYFSNLLDPMAENLQNNDYKDYPPDFIDTLRKANFNNTKLLFETYFYSKTAIKYFEFFKNRTSFKNKNDDSAFVSVYAAINQEYPNNSIKEFLLAAHLSNHLSQSFNSFDSLRYNFKSIYPKSRYNGYIDSLYILVKNKPKITLQDALNTVIFDKIGQKLTLNDLLKSESIIVLDCWASWCHPCLDEMPYARKLEDEYKCKVDFVYLSFDKNKSAWLKKTNDLQVSGSAFLIDNNFYSNFASFFSINSIPRYLIFKKGYLIDSEAPRPSDEQLKKLLNRLISSRN